MSAKQSTHGRRMLRVVVCGPNLVDQSRGTFHVHREGCADLKRHARREPEYENGWTIEAETREGVVRAIYADHMAEREAENDWLRANGRADEASDFTWRDYDDLYVFDCCKQLDVSDGEGAEQVRAGTAEQVTASGGAQLKGAGANAD